MDLATQYERQYAWRSWQQAYAMLPPLAGMRVLDLGCAVGMQARDLAARGARVVGIDANEELLAVARSRGMAGAEFHLGDIRVPRVDGPFDGLWGSFVPAYFPDLAPVLENWRALLKPGGWIALTEVSRMFEHEPLPPACRSLLRDYAREAREVGRYDFDMGSRLANELEDAGFDVEVDGDLPDREFGFSGPAQADVLQAWAERFERMRLLQERAGRELPSLQEEFLRCLGSSQHTSGGGVRFCLARR